MATRGSTLLSLLACALFGALGTGTAVVMYGGPIQPLPAGSHKSQPMIFFDDSIDMGVFSSTSLETMFWRHGINTVGLGFLDDGEVKCTIHVRYFYGRELCWDGRSKSFKESFPRSWAVAGGERSHR